MGMVGEGGRVDRILQAVQGAPSHRRYVSVFFPNMGLLDFIFSNSPVFVGAFLPLIVEKKTFFGYNSNFKNDFVN